MLGNFSERLCIPPAFLGKLQNHRSNGNAILEGPSSQRWSVRLCYTSVGMEFQKGWEKFVCDHRLELGDFLVFKYTCKSYFNVQIFGRSGCEKRNVFNMKNFGASLLSLEEKANRDAEDNCPDTLVKSFDIDRYQAVPKRTNSQMPVILYPGEDSKGQAMGTFKFKQSGAETCPNTAKHPRHGIAARSIKKTESCRPSFAGKKHEIVTSAETGGKSYMQAYFVSCRRAVTQEERNKAFKDANSFKSNKPWALIVMKPSHVYNGFWLAWPKRFGNCFQIPKERMQMTLLGPTNKEWQVQYLGDRVHGGFSGGWRFFSLENNIEEGDVCVFELVNTVKYCFKVHIFRVVKKCTPFKKMEGTKVNDKDGQCKKMITYPVNHSKKMKVSTTSTNKVATNLAVQASGRHIPDILEQGIVVKKEEKEVQKKKDHSSSPNKLVEMVKCICDSGKARRSSPRFNKVCNASEHHKKQLSFPAFANRKQTIDKDTKLLSSKTNILLDGANGEADLIIIWDSNDVAGPSNIIPSQESIREQPLVAKSNVQAVKQEN